MRMYSLKNNSNKNPLFRKKGRDYFYDQFVDATFTVCESLVAVLLKDIKCNEKNKRKILKKLEPHNENSKIIFKAKELQENENKDNKIIWKDYDNKLWVLKQIPVITYHEDYVIAGFKEKEDGNKYLKIYKTEESQVSSSWIAFHETNFMFALMALSDWNKKAWSEDKEKSAIRVA